MPRRDSRRGRFAAVLILGLLAATPLAAALDSTVGSVGVSGERSVRSLYPDLDGRGIVIAILDTGVDTEHATFDGAFVAGVDVSTPGVRVERNPGIPSSRPHDPDDKDGHGTHVAAIALGRGEAGKVAPGVAPAARLVDVKIASDVGALSLGGVERGLRWVLDYNAGRTTYGDPGANRIHVASVSFSTLGPGNAEDPAVRLVNELEASGVVVVVAAGNCGREGSASCASRGANTIGSPGVARGAITVGAVDSQGTPDREDDEIAGYSSYGPNGEEPKPNLVAPGSNVDSARCGACPPRNAGSATGAATMSGTSMAAPHVAGIAALILQAKGDLTPLEVKRLLMESAEKRWGGSDFSAAHGDHYADWSPARGAGYVDALAAVRKLKADNVPPVAVAQVLPSTQGTTATRFTFSSQGSHDPDGPLKPSSFEWNAEPLGLFFRGATWENVRFPAGNHTVTLTVTDADGARAQAHVGLVVLDAPTPPELDNHAPRARAVASSTEPEAGEGVSFDASLSHDPDGDALTYAWDFTGDGRADAHGEFVERSFTRAGLHLVTLVVTDPHGATDWTRLEIRVREPPAEPTQPPQNRSREQAAPPVVLLLSPVDGDVLDAGDVTLRWHARAAENAFLVAATVYVDDVVAARTNTTEAFARLAPGDRVLRVVVEDSRGATSEAVVRVLARDPVTEEAIDTQLDVGSTDDRGFDTPAPTAAWLLAGLAGAAWVCRRRLRDA